MVIHKFDIENFEERSRLIKEVDKVIHGKEVLLHCPASLEYTFPDSTTALMFVLYHTKEVDDLHLKFKDAEIGYHQKTNHFYCRIENECGVYLLKTLDSYRYGHPIHSGIVDESDIGYDPILKSNDLVEYTEESWNKLSIAVKEAITKKNDSQLISDVILKSIIDKYIWSNFPDAKSIHWELRSRKLSSVATEYYVSVSIINNDDTHMFRTLEIM